MFREDTNQGGGTRTKARVVREDTNQGEGISFVGSGLSTMEGMLINERNFAYAANIAKGMRRPLTNEIANLDGAIGKFGKYGKRLGGAGLLLTGGGLVVKYFNDGVTRKDIFDGVASGILFALTIANPALIIGVGVYGLLDSMNVFDGIKEHFGMDDTVVFKYQ